MKKTICLVLSIVTAALLCLVRPAAPVQAASAAASRPSPVIRRIPAADGSPEIVYRCLEEQVCAVSTLYVRSGPGSNFEVLGHLEKGEAVTRTAVGNNGFSQILFHGREAYANTTYLSVTPISAEETDSSITYQPVDDLIYATATTKLRSGPGFDYAVVGHLNRNNGARRVAIGSNGWSRIIFHDTEVYACTACLADHRPDGPDGSPREPRYRSVDELVYATDNVNLRSGPGTGFEALGTLPRGNTARRTAIGDDGWSRVLLESEEVWICSAYLSLEPVGEISPIVTSGPELPTPNAPFLYQYVAPEGILPHAFFRPAHDTGSEPLPLIISLHGALEIGEQPETLESNFLTKEFRNWEYTGLEGFDAYIICPQLTGFGYADSWSCPESADNLFALIDYMKAHYPIDEHRISIEGHSLGGQGALYMAADPRASFAAVIPISGYDPYIPLDTVNAAVRGYTGSPYLPAPREDWTSFNFMNEAFGKYFGPGRLFMKNCSHYDIPMVALEEDLDANGRSDLIDWILQQKK